MPARIPIGTLSDFPQGQGVPVTAGGRRLAVFRLGERFFAIDNVCTHNRMRLADGPVQGVVVTCRTHGSRFNLETGAVVKGPARKPVRTYPVFLVGETIEVEVD
ncbi:MAG TPA: non-heme iron oxygenase ferredoxin subunit [Candidatus Binatia bacterium]|nr:non-heme iron oxygenase ferredoxin subunit [Candidatus Binatia bacterium]